MEVLSMQLSRASQLPNFNYHWRAKETKLTHLCFADDLLIFCHGSMESVSIVHSCIHSFSMFSGLIPNTQKSQCFLANTEESTTQDILRLLDIPLGSLPIKFLGVPLISSKLSFQDCLPLIQRITSRVTSWTSISLAYSGRLILIKSVLFSIQSFWSAHFILPKAVIRSINSILTRFLWKGPSLASHGAKVAWSSITLPYKEGGLALKSINEWNKALIIMHLIHIIQFNTHSLWARWVNSTVIKQQNFWHLDIPKDCSWIWRQVLKLRPLALTHIQYHVGRGDHINLWYDPWMMGRFPHPSPLLITNSGLPVTARVSDIIANNAWSPPISNHHEVLIFRRILDSFPPPPAREDLITWQATDINKLRAKIIWESIRSRSLEVNWHKILWHKHHVPRYSFTLWLGILRRLPTSDITMHYSNQGPILCQLCQQHNETFEHLFFACDYSSLVFQSALNVGSWHNVPMDWTGMLHFVSRYKGRKLTKDILRLSLSTSFYKIWESRNSKLHNNVLIPPRILANEVINIIKSRLSQSSTFTRAVHSSQYYCNWL